MKDMNEAVRVEKQLDGTEIRVGCCRFCGQAYQLEVVGEWTDEMLDEAATNKCDCIDAENWKKIQKRKKKAKETVEELFADEEEDILELLKDLAGKTLEGRIRKAAIVIGSGAKAAVSISAKGGLKIERTETKKGAREI